MVRRLLGDRGLPAGWTGGLDADERVLAAAPLVGGGHVVATSLGVWLPDPESRSPVDDQADGTDVRRVGWHLVSKATWADGAIGLVEADEVDVVDGVVLIVDRPVRRLRPTEPGRVPQVVHERVTASVRTRHHRELPGGGAWFVQRKVPGRDGTVLQVRADPGTDEAALREVVTGIARTLGSAP